MTAKPPPTIEALLQEVASPSQDVLSSDRIAEVRQVEIRLQQEADNLGRQTQYSKLKAFEDHHVNKGRWSRFVTVAMSGMIGFQSLLLGLVGAGVWDFSKYDWLLPGLLVQNLAQVITLAAIIVKALYDNHKE